MVKYGLARQHKVTTTLSGINSKPPRGDTGNLIRQG
jgi:hypothetical protein